MATTATARGAELRLTGTSEDRFAYSYRNLLRQYTEFSQLPLSATLKLSDDRTGVWYIAMEYVPISFCGGCVACRQLPIYLQLRVRHEKGDNGRWLGGCRLYDQEERPVWMGWRAHGIAHVEPQHLQDLCARHGGTAGRDGQREGAFSGILQEVDSGDGSRHAAADTVRVLP